MSFDHREELRRLDALVERFHARVKKTIEGARFHRSADRSAEVYKRAHAAYRQVELASSAFEGGAEQERKEDRDGWLGSRVSGLVRYLTRSNAADRTGEEDASGLTGDSSSLSIPDLLSMLQVQSKTGILRILHPSENFVLHLLNGELVHGFSERTPEGFRLGEILVKQGALSQQRLESILFCRSASAPPIGERLREGNIVSEEELEAALTYQVQQLFHRLFELEDASFRFEPGLPRVDDNRARLNLMQLLLESARVHDERKAG